MLELKGKMNLQMFADWDEVITNHADAFEEGSNLTESFGVIQTKLEELGYDVLINNKERAEFVPSTRLGEVVSQRDGFKKQVEDLNATLTELQGKAGDNQQLKDDYQALIDKNNLLLGELETTRVNTEIMLEAKDALDPKDLLLFINHDNITTNAKGEVLGVAAEINRLRTEKAYLFQGETKPKNKAGIDGAGNEDNSIKSKGMNAAIRRATGRSF